MENDKMNELANQLLATDGLMRGEVPDEFRKESDAMIEKVNKRARNAKHRMIAAWIVVAACYAAHTVLNAPHEGSPAVPGPWAAVTFSLFAVFFPAALVLTIISFAVSRTARFTEVNARLIRLESELLRTRSSQTDNQKR